ncbi:MAG: putative lipid II flippase FtsW [Candidatus Nanopelagicales bacterium]
MEKHASPVPARSMSRRVPAQASFQLIRGSAILLLFIGLIMVLSSSYYESKLVYGSEFTIFFRQSLYALLGAIALVILAKIDLDVFRRLIPLILLGVVGLLLLVFIPGLGSTVGGQTNWLDFGFGIRLQPSEFAKFALIVFGAHQLSTRHHFLNSKSTYVAPVIFTTGLVMALIMFAGDLGNAVVIGLAVGLMLFVANAPLRYFAGAAVIGTGVIGIMAYLRPYRMDRITSWLNPEADPEGAGFQAMHAKFALASGGFFGQGLGASREKWGTLPEAHTDFIFAIIGEELGMLGAIAILTLFLILCAGIITLGRNSSSDFVRYVCAGAVGWIGGQAMINIGAVLGVLPIMGVPLPLVSTGGSALIPTLAMIGLLLTFAQREIADAASEESAEKN